MQTVAASELKQNSMRLQDALRDDLLVTKRDKPFVVVMDYEKYELIKACLGSTSKESIRRFLEESEKKVFDLTTFSRGGKRSDFSREDAYGDEI